VPTQPTQSLKSANWTLKFDGDLKLPDIKGTSRSYNPQDFTATASYGDDGSPTRTDIPLDGTLTTGQTLVFVVVKVHPDSLKDVVKPLKVKLTIVAKPPDPKPAKDATQTGKTGCGGGDTKTDDTGSEYEQSDAGDSQTAGDAPKGGAGTPPAAPPAADPAESQRDLSADTGKNGLGFINALTRPYGIPQPSTEKPIPTLQLWNENPVDIKLLIQVGAGPVPKAGS
jgi:hypothetical protein